MQHTKGLSIGSPFVLLKKKTSRKMSKGGMLGSNPRHSEPQSDALPTELRPPFGELRSHCKLEIENWTFLQKRVQRYCFFLKYANIFHFFCKKFLYTEKL